MNKNSNILDQVEKYILEDNLDAVASSVSYDEIENAEKEIGLKFDKIYKLLISKYGAIDINGQFIYGLRYVILMDESCWSVIDNTKFFKETQNWPGIEDWYIVSDDGSGNPIGINPKGEVWLSDHNSNFEQIKLADNFEEFLYKLLTDTLYE